MIDPTLLAQIREAVEAASPGPWKDRERRVFSLADSMRDERGDFALIAQDVYGPDGPFIALARTAVPALLSELDRLRAEAAMLWPEAHEAHCRGRVQPTNDGPRCDLCGERNPYESR